MNAVSTGPCAMIDSWMAWTCGGSDADTDTELVREMSYCTARALRCRNGVGLDTDAIDGDEEETIVLHALSYVAMGLNGLATRCVSDQCARPPMADRGGDPAANDHNPKIPGGIDPAARTCQRATPPRDV